MFFPHPLSLVDSASTLVAAESTMERPPSSAQEQDSCHHKRSHFSCWETMGLANLWRKLVARGRRRRRRRGKLYVKRGSFGYDPLSYAQNFDDGQRKGEEEDVYTLYFGFSSRFAALSAPK